MKIRKLYYSSEECLDACSNVCVTFGQKIAVALSRSLGCVVIATILFIYFWILSLVMVAPPLIDTFLCFALPTWFGFPNWRYTKFPGIPDFFGFIFLSRTRTRKG